MITILLIIIAASVYFFISHRKLRTQLNDQKESINYHIKAVTLKREFMERELQDWANFQKQMDLRLKKLENLISIPKGKVIKSLPFRIEPEVKSE